MAGAEDRWGQTPSIASESPVIWVRGQTPFGARFDHRLTGRGAAVDSRTINDGTTTTVWAN